MLIENSFNSHQFSFDKLPSNILENIFKFLSYKEVIKFKAVSAYTYNVCCKYFKRSLLRLRKCIFELMKILSHEINHSLINTNPEVRQQLQLFNILESINENLDMVTALNRHLLENDDICVPIVVILDKYFKILKEVDLATLKADSLSLMNLNLERNFTLIMEDMNNNKMKLRDMIPLGVRTVDLLDLIRNVSYNIVATYNIKSQMCQLSMKYYLEHPKLLTYLPIIPYVKDCRNRRLTLDEQDAVIKYLIMLVNVHNKLESKAEQYKRELELTKRENSKDQNLITSILSDDFKHSKHRKYIIRKVLDAESGKIQETYKNVEEKIWNYQGMTCTIQLRCPLHEAPLRIKANFDKICDDIEFEDISVQPLTTTIFKEIEQSIGSNIYSFNCKLRVCIPSKIKEIFEVNFEDGNF